MRRIAKPFTVEVKKRGRKRDAERSVSGPEPVTHGASDAPPHNTSDWVTAHAGLPARDPRFRDAENLFRTAVAEPQVSPAISDPTVRPEHLRAASRRILPDLAAEAALSDAVRAAMPEPRRRGRPPKARDHVGPSHAKPPRQPMQSDAQDDAVAFEDASVPTIPVPAVLYLAASARRRAARVTDTLPRGQRWKRRLPKVCW